jgi:hypothetical protein
VTPDLHVPGLNEASYIKSARFLGYSFCETALARYRATTAKLKML